MPNSNQIVLRMSANRHTLSGPDGVVDLSPFFTVTRDRQGLRADRAGEFQRRFVNPAKEMFARA